MAQSRFSRRLGFLVILAALSFSMVLPAFALFDQDDTARGDQSLPIAENFSLTTYRDVAVSGTFSAVDPEGDPLTFRVTKNPARGAITFAEEGSARFTYTPYENKTGKDSFTYVAEDGGGECFPARGGFDQDSEAGYQGHVFRHGRQPRPQGGHCPGGAV